MTFDGRTATLSELGLHSNDQTVEILGLAVDSRVVKPGYLFAALPGTNVHGGEFIQYALRMGAAAILTDKEGAAIAREELSNHGAALVVTEDPRQALAFASALWFGRQPDTMVAVTGTNGKTSVSSFTRQIWSALGIEAANFGTAGVEGAYSAPLAHTTPEPITLHQLLSELDAFGVTHATRPPSLRGAHQMPQVPTQAGAR